MSEVITDHRQIDDLEFYGALDYPTCEHIGIIRFQSVYDQLSDKQKTEYRQKLIRSTIDQISELFRAHQPEFIVILGNGLVYGGENGTQFEPNANWCGLTAFLYPSIVDVDSPFF